MRRPNFHNLSLFEDLTNSDANETNKQTYFTYARMTILSNEDEPSREIIEGIPSRYVVHQHGSDRPSEVRFRHRLEGEFPSGVPNLQAERGTPKPRGESQGFKTLSQDQMTFGGWKHRQITASDRFSSAACNKRGASYQA